MQEYIILLVGKIAHQYCAKMLYVNRIVIFIIQLNQAVPVSGKPMQQTSATD